MTTNLSEADERADFVVRRLGVAANISIGFLVVFGLLGTTVAWLATTQISGAVVASGLVVVDSNVKKIQHPTGGVVAEIAVKEGQRVKAGDLLVRLDETVLNANLQLVSRQLNETVVRQARMRAELTGAGTISYPPGVSGRMSDVQIAEITKAEEELFRARRTGRDNLKSQFDKRIEQLGNEIDGLSAEMKAKEKEWNLATLELKGLEQLEAKNLINTAKITASRRLVAQIEGTVAEVMSRIAQTHSRIAEMELAVLQLDQDMKSEVGKELRDQQAKQAELEDRLIAAQDQLERVVIRAPQHGIVHHLTAHTIGGVIAPGEPILSIVPNADKLVVEAKVAPQDIDQVGVGQKAKVRFIAFNQRTTPEIDAVVSRVSADLTIEAPTRAGMMASGVPVGAPAYYVVRLELAHAAKSVLGSKSLIPGMPADVLIKTEDRTALSYLVKPLEDQFARAFRER